MGRSPCCEKVGLKKGPWTPEEDQKLLAYIEEHGHGSWRALPAKAGLQRCGKSCRLRWTNYLRPDIKRGKFSLQEEQTIIQLHALLGNKWSAIATHLAKRTDNEIKNYWNTHLKKRLTKMGIDPVTHKPKSVTLTTAEGHTKGSANLSHMAQWESARLEAEARLVRESKLRATTNPTSPASTFPVQLSAPRLDMLRAWQGGWSSKSTRNCQSQSHGGINLESPTSTLTFSENKNPEEAVDWKSLTRPINKDQTRIDRFVVVGSQTEQSFFSPSGVVLNASFGDGFTEMLMEKYSYDHEENSSSEGNLVANSGSICGGSGGGVGENEEEHKSYWNNILKLVNSANISDSLPLF